MLQDGTATRIWLKHPGRLWGSRLPIFCFPFPRQMGSHTLIFMQVTQQEPVQPVLWREALMDWVHQCFTRTEPSSQPGDQQNRKQLSFSPRSFYQGFALRAYLNGTRALRKCEGTPVKWTIPLLVFLAGREPFYWARTNSQNYIHNFT